MTKQDSLVKATEATAIELTPKTVKAYLSPNATDQEVALFLNQCVMFELNPFKREIYLIKYGSNPATFVVGYEAYLKRAERTGKYAGMKSGTVDDSKTGKPIKAWVKVYRKDWTEPLEHEVYLDEYIQKTKEGQPTRFWNEKPRTMLKKVAISQAFRMAFPDEFAGMPYTAEEMPVDHSKLPATEVKAEVVDPQAELEADGEVVNEAPVGKFDKLPEFTKAKKALGDRVYYDCLGTFGFEKSNQVPPEQRDAILKVMRTMYRDLHPAQEA
jgi:phage recombination protein Bet